MMYSKILYILIVNYACALGSSIRQLSCNSMNAVKDTEEASFIYITPKQRECIFLFKGPKDQNLIIKVHGLANNDWHAVNGKCGNATIDVYDYKFDTFEASGNPICSSKDEMEIQTRSNMGIVRSRMANGSFFVKVRSQRSLEKRLSGVDFNIIGMGPPFLGSEDYFRSPVDTFSLPVISSGSNFRPSFGVPGYPPLQTSYGQNLIRPSYGPPSHIAYPYPGKPGDDVEITSSNPIIAINETIVTPNLNTTTIVTSLVPSPKPTTTEYTKTPRPTKFTEPTTAKESTEPTTTKGTGESQTGATFVEEFFQ